MMAPTIEARMLQALRLKGDEKVLEIGTGSGFMTACLATRAAHVTSIDIHDDFIESAKKKLLANEFDNVHLEKMDAKIVVRKDGNDCYSENLFETDLAPLTNGTLPPQFDF